MGDVRVKVRWHALAVGLLAAAIIAALYGVRDVPGWAVELVGGAGDGVARYGGLAAIDRHGKRVELQRISAEGAAAAVYVVNHGGLQFREVIQSQAVEGLVPLGLVPDPTAGPRSTDPAIAADAWDRADGMGREVDEFLVGTRARLVATFAVAEQRGWQPPPNTAIAYGLEGKDTWRSYFVATAAEVGWRDVTDAFLATAPDTGAPSIELEYSADGARKLAQLTERIAGHKLAVVVGESVLYAPVIDAPFATRHVSIQVVEGSVDARGLVDLLRSGASAIDGPVTSDHWQPGEAGRYALRARGMLALLAGLAGAALVWLLLAIVRPLVRSEPRSSGTGGLAWRSFAWTALAGAVYLAGTYLDVPGIHAELVHGWHARDLECGGVFALGFTPLAVGFALVEIAAALVPRWRGSRHTPAGRQRLGVAIAIVTGIAAAVQAYLVVKQLAHAWDAVDNAPLAIATLAAGPMVLAVLADLVGRRGIGNGYAALAVVGYLWISWTHLGELSGAGRLLAISAAAGEGAVVLGVLRWRVASTPLPVTGILPLALTGGALATAGLFGLGLRWLPLRFDHFAGGGVTVLVVLAVVAACAFVPPRRQDIGAWLRAALGSVAAVLALFALGRAATGYATGMLVNPLAVAVTAAAIADLLAEAGVRGRAALVPAWPLHEPRLVERARECLATAGIPHYIQSTRLRTLLWTLGGFAPMTVLVAPEHVDAARDALASAVG